MVKPPDSELRCCGQTTVHRRSIYKNLSKNNEKRCCLHLDIFSCVKINVFRLFFLFSDSRCMSDEITSINWSRWGK